MANPPYGHNKATQHQHGWGVKGPAILGDTSTDVRIEITPDKFDELIRQRGARVLVYRTLPCPNIKSVDSAEHEIDCVLCSGSKALDVEPLETMAFIQSQTMASGQQPEGLIENSKAQMTFLIGVELEYFTRIDLCDYSMGYSEAVLRSPNSLTDVLKYNALRVNVVMDAVGVQYYQDSDFIIDSNGDILWGGGTTPADNVIFSIHYEARAQYRATNAVHVNRFTQTALGDGLVAHQKFQESWLCTKEFLVKRKNESGTELQQGPYDNHTIVPDP